MLSAALLRLTLRGSRIRTLRNEEHCEMKNTAKMYDEVKGEQGLAALAFRKFAEVYEI